jgi:GNAT superfamily N-acetyltransferase
MIDQDLWPSAEAANRAELLAYIGTGSCLESYRASNIAWVITGVPSADYNGVIWPRLSDEEADQLSPILVDRFRMHQLPSIWHLDAGAQPSDLSDRLRALGCTELPAATSMGASIVDATKQMRTLPQLSVERVTTTEELSLWMDVWTDVTKEPRTPREQLYISLGLKRLEPLRHYLARLDRRPVGVSQLFLGQQTAGIHQLAVREDFRRLGIGRALAQQPLLEARTLGYELAVAAPGSDSEPLFAALRFGSFRRAGSAYRLWP